MLTTDRKQLLKLALVLRVDIDFLIDSIDTGQPVDPDEGPRSQFVEGLGGFLRDAFGLPQEQIGILLTGSNKVGSTAMHNGPATSESLAGSPFNHRKIAVSPATGQEVMVRIPVPATSATTAAPALRIMPVSTTVLIPSPSKAVNGDANDFPRPPIFGRRRLWFPSIPSRVTPSILSRRICGGPLTQLVEFPDEKYGTSDFLIEFLRPESATAFMGFIKSRAGRLRFPGKEINYASWDNETEYFDTHIQKAAMESINPARRVLIFRRYASGSARMNKKEIEDKLRGLEKRFNKEFSVEDYQYTPQKAELTIVFNKIEAAIVVTKLHRTRSLWADLDNCNVVFGKDPSDQAIYWGNRVLKVGVVSAIPKHVHRPLAALGPSSVRFALPAPKPPTNSLPAAPGPGSVRFALPSSTLPISHVAPVPVIVRLPPSKISELESVSSEYASPPVRTMYTVSPLHGPTTARTRAPLLIAPASSCEEAKPMLINLEEMGPKDTMEEDSSDVGYSSGANSSGAALDVSVDSRASHHSDAPASHASEVISLLDRDCEPLGFGSMNPTAPVQVPRIVADFTLAATSPFETKFQIPVTADEERAGFAEMLFAICSE